MKLNSKANAFTPPRHKNGHVTPQLKLNPDVATFTPTVNGGSSSSHLKTKPPRGHSAGGGFHAASSPSQHDQHGYHHGHAGNRGRSGPVRSNPNLNNNGSSPYGNGTAMHRNASSRGSSGKDSSFPNTPGGQSTHSATSGATPRTPFQFPNNDDSSFYTSTPTSLHSGASGMSSNVSMAPLYSPSSSRSPYFMNSGGGISQPIVTQSPQHRAIVSPVVRRRKMKPLCDELVFRQEPEDRFTLSKIRVVQYNMLADTYALEMAFPYVKNKYLRWQYRGVNLVQELSTYEADIIALQEVDHFSDFLQPQLRQYGYEGVFYKRPGSKRDGCAIFYRTSMFTAQDEFHLDYNELASKKRRGSFSSCVNATTTAVPPSSLVTSSSGPAITTAGRSSAAHGRVASADSPITPGSAPRLKRKQSVSQPSSPRVSLVGASREQSTFRTSNVAFGVYLVDNNGFGLWVVTTHLHWDPKMEQVKDAQADLLRKRVEELTHKYPKNTGVILCGDINSTPDSSVYDLLTNPRDRKNPLHVVGMKSEEKREADSDTGSNTSHHEGGDKKVREPLQLRSIFHHKSEPSFTNFTQKFKGTLDYIFHTPNVLAPLCALSTPPMTELESDTALPNELYSSDHIAMVADLQWKRIPQEEIMCSKGVDCRNPACVDIHPLLCGAKMDCKVKGCELVHVPPCKFGITCQMRFCQFNHLPCRRGPCGRFCMRQNCPYTHIELCRFGYMCNRKECHYSHPSRPAQSPQMSPPSDISTIPYGVPLEPSAFSFLQDPSDPPSSSENETGMSLRHVPSIGESASEDSLLNSSSSYHPLFPLKQQRQSQQQQALGDDDPEEVYPIPQQLFSSPNKPPKPNQNSSFSSSVSDSSLQVTSQQDSQSGNHPSNGGRTSVNTNLKLPFRSLGLAFGGSSPFRSQSGTLPDKSQSPSFVGPPKGMPIRARPISSAPTSKHSSPSLAPIAPPHLDFSPRVMLLDNVANAHVVVDDDSIIHSRDASTHNTPRHMSSHNTPRHNTPRHP